MGSHAAGKLAIVRATMSPRLLLSVVLVANACTGKTPAPAADGGATNDGKAEKPKAAVDPKLLDPDAANAQAPATYRVKFDTTKGPFTIEVTREWAPLGADRFYNLVKLGFFDDVAFFRAIQGFMVQFGLHGQPEVTRAWKAADLRDDPRTQRNAKGTISFANRGPNTRSTQVFINFNDNAPLDSMGFAPFGRVVEGMDIVESLHTGYGEGAPQGAGPDQMQIEREGNDYLRRRFPKLDWIKTAVVEK
jgi:peptidyl-prolyl cis-trans isomerase A (cyclophilin A)